MEARRLKNSAKNVREEEDTAAVYTRAPDLYQVEGSAKTFTWKPKKKRPGGEDKTKVGHRARGDETLGKKPKASVRWEKETRLVFRQGALTNS